MKTRILLISIILFFATISVAEAASFSYYFANSGNDNNNCFESSPCKTITKAKSMIDAKSSADIVYLYFKKGSTWTWASAMVSKKSTELLVSSNNPIVHIDAYGTGTYPVFDGLVTNFSSVPIHSTVNGPLKWNRFFEFQRDGCSLSNLEIKNTYGYAVYLNNANNFKLLNNYIHNLGNSAINNNYRYNVENIEVAHNTIHTVIELYKYEKMAGWPGAIGLIGSGYGSMYKNNYVHHNLVYDSYGECINAPNSLIEHNIVGSCGSVALNTATQDFDALDSVVRYNFVIFEDYNESVYDNHSGGERSCFRVFDEKTSGDNSKGTQEFYGNICINYLNGVKMPCNKLGDNECNPWKSVNINHNLFIDNRNGLYTQSDFHSEGIYATNELLYNNNSVILFDQVDRTLINDRNNFPSSGWGMTNNHYWVEGGTPNFSKANIAWENNKNIEDPLLPGNSSLNWDGLSGPNYYKQLSFKNHLYPSANSPLNDIGITKEYLQAICEELPIDMDCGDEVCIPNVSCNDCTNWTNCQNQNQTRTCTCTDANNCEADYQNEENRTCTKQVDQLIAYYTMDENDINNNMLQDKSNNNINASIHGNPTITAGKQNNALHFNGTSDYLDTNYTDTLNKFTVSVWLKGDNAPRNTWDSGPVMKYDNFLIAYDHTSDRFRNAATVNTNNIWHPATFGTLNANTWYYLTTTYDGETLRTYKDGQLVSTNQDPSGAPNNSNYSMKIAKHAKNDYYFQGTIDEVKVYNYALSQSEIETNYNSYNSQETNYNINHFIELITDWLKTISSNMDLNNDGKVNTKDLGIMMSGWE